MRLKYYLRGAGIGVLFSVISFFIYLTIVPVEISDAEIKKRAADLGMVEEDELLNDRGTIRDSIENQNENIEDDEHTGDIENAEESEEAESLDQTQADVTEEPAVENEPVAEQTSNNRGETTEINEGTFTVSPGTNSYAVAMQMQELGIISSASDFDAYMSSQGADGRLRTGTYTLNSSMSYDEMIRILCG